MRFGFYFLFSCLGNGVVLGDKGTVRRRPVPTRGIRFPLTVQLRRTLPGIKKKLNSERKNKPDHCVDIARGIRFAMWPSKDFPKSATLPALRSRPRTKCGSR